MYTIYFYIEKRKQNLITKQLDAFTKQETMAGYKKIHSFKFFL